VFDPYDDDCPWDIAKRLFAKVYVLNHTFLFIPGYWLGEGKIVLNMMDDALPFFTRWKVSPQDEDGRIEATQEIQIAGLAETMHNAFRFSEVSAKGFTIELENQNLGHVVGKGIIKPDVVGWEFRLPHLGFEGFEFYERGDDEGYKLHAEYATNDDFRTVIRGRVWKQLVTAQGEGR
jgi:hypothetical protein